MPEILRIEFLGRGARTTRESGSVSSGSEEFVEDWAFDGSEEATVKADG